MRQRTADACTFPHFGQAPDKPDKGKMNGSCNRRACQAPGATWFNKYMDAHYCEPCAAAINHANRDLEIGPLCVPPSTPT